MMLNTANTHQRVENLNLDNVREALIKKEKFSSERAESAIESYQAFLLMLAQNPNEVLVPNEDVDQAWHHHILDTEKYMGDCESLFGGYLHHNPHYYGTQAFLDSCDKTQEIYQNTFGKKALFVLKPDSLNERYESMKNPQSASCGGMVKAQPASCGGMIKAASCGGMVKAQPASCGGMIKAASCGGMVKAQPASCGGMIKAASCGGMINHS